MSDRSCVPVLPAARPMPARGAEGLVEVTRGSQEWQCHADCVGSLFGPSGLRLEEWQSAGCVRVVKTGPHRTVYYVASGCGGLFIKQYRVIGWLGELQHLVRPSRAELEWDAARRVEAAGIPTFESLAVGVTRSGRRIQESWLVTREIPDIQPVDEFVESLLRQDGPRVRRIRSELARQLGRLVGRLHRFGLIHRDLHAGNVLVRSNREGSLFLWLIDLHAVGAAKTMRFGDVERNIALLNNFFVGRATDSERLRFTRGWWEELTSAPVPPLHRRGGEGPGVRGTSGDIALNHRSKSWTSQDAPLNSWTYSPSAPLTPYPSPPAKPWGEGSSLHSTTSVRSRSFAAAARRLAAHCAASVLDAYRQGDEKWRRGNRRLIIADTRTTRCRGLSVLGREFLTSFRDRPKSVFADADAHGNRSILIETEASAIEATVQRFAAPSDWFTHCRHRLSGGTALHAWEMGSALFRRGIPAVRPLAFVEPKRGGEGILLVERHADSIPLSEWLRRPANLERRTAALDASERPVIENLARTLRRLHTLGFVHEALTAANIRIEADHAGRRKIRLDGLADVRPIRRVTQECLFGQLCTLAASVEGPMVRLTLMATFVQTYLGQKRRSEWKGVWRAVASRLPASQKQHVLARPVIASATRRQTGAASSSLPSLARGGRGGAG